MSAPEPTSEAEEEEARRRDGISVEGRLQAEGTTTESWWLPVDYDDDDDDDDDVSLGVLCKNFRFTTRDKHTHTFAFLKIVWLWMQVGQKIHFIFLFHSRHTHKALMSSQRGGLTVLGCGRWDRFFSFSVLRVSKAGGYHESGWEAAVQHLLQSPSMWPIPSFSSAEVQLKPWGAQTSLTSWTVCVCARRYEDFSSYRK